MVNRVGASPALDRTAGSPHNHAEWRGGAMLIDYGSGPRSRACTFEGNRSDGHGGGVFLESVAAQLGIIGTHFDGCVFAGKPGTLRGGAYSLR